MSPGGGNDAVYLEAVESLRSLLSSLASGSLKETNRIFKHDDITPVMMAMVMVTLMMVLTGGPAGPAAPSSPSFPFTPYRTDTGSVDACRHE